MAGWTMQTWRPPMRGFQNFLSISQSQKTGLPDANWLSTIHHGIPPQLYTLDAEAGANGTYLAFLGRLSRDKRPDRAIEIARRTGLKLKLAAKIGDGDRDYFAEVIEPLIDGDQIEYVGEIPEHAKNEFLGNAAGLLFPIDWPEPFGLAVIEAMACGTPVMAWSCGAMPEVVDHGVSGILVETLEDAVTTMPGLLSLDRRRVRATFEERFSASRMARDYVSAYRQLVGSPTQLGKRVSSRNSSRNLPGAIH